MTKTELYKLEKQIEGLHYNVGLETTTLVDVRTAIKIALKVLLQNI